jgi:hypothetical protein
MSIAGELARFVTGTSVDDLPPPRSNAPGW